MPKSRRDVQREIYQFIEDAYLETGQPVKLQDVHDKFCKKYGIATTTVQRYLDELVNRKSPFRLRTWYDKNRYYCIPTVSAKVRLFVAVSIIIPFVTFFLDILAELPFLLFEKAVCLLAGFWICFVLTRKKEGNLQNRFHKV